MTKVKKVKLGRKGQVVIPKEVREALGLQEGDMLLVGVEEGGRVVLAPPEEYARRTKGALHGIWGGKKEISIHIQKERDAWEGRLRGS
ncbi:AbrB/MazE/SpoVT family DNA-binding domain-containing protein [Candidatus Bipolaricaulota bacterium]|nr:AbrB/MazE/SpoVT family DNA-binding domain-containing protein [Candidatus Bipolaricaulota bacterium]